MTIKLIFLLYFYYVFLIAWLLFFGASIFHMMKYGFKNVVTIVSTTTFVLVSILLLGISFYYIAQIDWDAEIELFAMSLNFIC